MQDEIQKYLNNNKAFTFTSEVDELFAQYGLLPYPTHTRSLVYRGNSLEAFIGLTSCSVWVISTVAGINSCPLFHVDLQD
jgi:hypothetical protein